MDNDWLGYKNDSVDDTRNVVNIVRSCQWREQGINSPHSLSNKTVLENIAEDILVQKSLNIRSCDLPGYPRSTFLMVFSPDGTKVASTHGNHNVYVSELASGKHVRILKGHPRTPWCIAFHPSHPQLIGSGCLGGQVRVWDIASGGSEVWNVRNETVIASIAFHPRDQLLVIATHNELYFWDWSQPAPFTKVSTNNVNEKVRYVAFDALGYKLITGIALWANASGGSNLLVQQNQPMGPSNNSSNTRRDDPDDSPSGPRGQESPGSAQDMIVNSYQNLVQRYDSLVRNYQRLFRVRHRLVNTSTPPPPPHTMDRGTDPMETDVSTGMSSWSRPARPSTSTSYDDVHQNTSRPNRQDNGDCNSEPSSSRLFNLDVLSINPTRNQPTTSSNQEHSIFGSRSSAFQPLSDSRRTSRTDDSSERSTRLLPNPFSSSNNSPRLTRHSSDGLYRSVGNTSRTSIFTSSRTDSDLPSLARDYARLRRNSPSQTPRSAASTSGPQQRPTMTSTSTQMNPVTPADAQSINESLDLIRDILRDSGTRLLNLITNMSLTTLASMERSMPRRGQSDSGEGRPRLRLFSSSLGRDFLSSSSDSDSDRSLEVNIFRTRNSSFREDREDDRSAAASDAIPPSDNRLPATERMVFELNNDFPTSEISRDESGFNMSVSRCRFRVRSRNDSSPGEGPNTSNNRDRTGTRANIWGGAGPSNIRNRTEISNVRNEGSTSNIRNRVDTSNVRNGSEDSNSRNATETSNLRTTPETSNMTNNIPTDNINEMNPSEGGSSSNFDYNRPSTSRDTNNSPRSNVIPPQEAYRKVKSGVKALQKHTIQLTNMWLRGNRTTMRELRIMWENLRRRVLMLHRETGRQDSPSYYTRTLLERCMMLTEISNNINMNSNRNSRSNQRNEDNERNVNESRDESVNSDNTNYNASASEPNTSTGAHTDNRQQQAGRSPSARTSSGFRSSPSMRRRLQSSYRWRPEDELRRRTRNPTANRLTARYSRSRRDLPRAFEISATRHEIHMRAMQVLSVMFNMMMMCLEERGLSQIIIDMLRTLKKALALTCLMLMTNRNNGRSGNNPTVPAQSVESLNVVRIQNVDHTGPVNVDGPDDPASPHVTTEVEDDRSQRQTNENKHVDDEKPSTSQSTSADSKAQEGTRLVSRNIAQIWSDRLAVQIAAANRNNSATARNRRELYLESRRLKALHRTNPTAHPLIRKRALPPISTYRIPALRSLPSRIKVTALLTPRTRSGTGNNNEPVAGPSNAPFPTDNPNPNRPGNSEVMNEFEHRVNLIRIAHMQAVSFRNAARNRFRRLQTIRLYTPSSVREMFALSTNNSDNQQSNRSPLQNAPENNNRRTFATYRPHILTPRSETASRSADDFHSALNNVTLPLMQVNDQPSTSEAQGSPQPQRLPRIHEYLQPIILAQNAMVVDVEGNGGEGGSPGGGGLPAGGGGGAGAGAGAARRMSGIAGLLDAGIISEAQPAPSHRVQAWDFTTGTTPDIADSTKNVVVQRCKIHNDASIDISKDGRLLVALLPVTRFRNTNQWLGVYSLEWPRLGQCLHTAALEQSAVSVALSPTGRHLAVGLGSRRITTTPHSRNNVFALLYRLDAKETPNRSGLLPIKELEQNWEHSFTSLNCIRWAPQPGQGLVYANNTGQLIIMS